MSDKPTVWRLAATEPASLKIASTEISVTATIRIDIGSYAADIGISMGAYAEYSCVAGPDSSRRDWEWRLVASVQVSVDYRLPIFGMTSHYEATVDLRGRIHWGHPLNANPMLPGPKDK